MKVTISQEFDSIEAAQAFLSQFAPAVVVDPQPVPASSSNVAAKRGRPGKTQHRRPRRQAPPLRSLRPPYP